MLSMKTIIQILFVWQENDLVFGNNLVFSSGFAKKQYKNNNTTTAPFLHKHITQIKIQDNKGSISGPRGKGIHIFNETINLFIVED